MCALCTSRAAAFRGAGCPLFAHPAPPLFAERDARYLGMVPRATPKERAFAFPSRRRYIFAKQTLSPINRSLRPPMIKLIALYRTPSDTAEFDKHYFDVHIPLIRKFPGLRKIEVTRVTGAPIGEAKFHLMAEMYFDSKDAMDAALGSPEGKAVTRDIMSFAADVITVFHGEPE
jgi:uncharacterized protein (TIGR02118 family)